MQAVYYDGQSSRAHPVELSREGGRLLISGEEIDLALPVSGIEVSARLSDIPRIVQLPGGAQLHCPDNDAVDAMFPDRSTPQALVHRLEQYWPAALLSVAVVLLAGILFFVHAVPWIGDQAARRLPPEAESVLAAQVRPVLERMGVRDSELPAERRQALASEFRALVRHMPGAEDYTLEFARWRGIPNAFALPGGTVVLTDDLIEVLEEDRLIVAVMAHEIGHLVHRHVIRSVAQSASVFIVFSLALGDVGGLAALTAGVPTFFVDNHFSREFEREADRFAFDLLEAAGYSAADFADAMEKLVGHDPTDEHAGLHYLSTHPPTGERVRAAREAAGR